MGKIIEFIFTRVYVAMLVTGIFWVLTICGGILLGVGPASATIMSLYAENGMNYKDYHWSRAWGHLQRKSCSGQSSFLHLLYH